MLMNWPREFELTLVEDPRFEQGKSRFGPATAFFYEGKEIAHFQQGGIDIRLTAAGIYALQSRLTEDCVLSVAKDWVLLRLASEEDNKFAQAILERAIREAHNANPRPTGKKTRRTPARSGKSEATRAFGIAKALKELEEFDPGAQQAPLISKPKKPKRKAKK